uniref:Integrase catalytic domain-containing protein n=1 Tax=Chromera velia CCMP2878 TaxID=1169474 RepID=A0A0K6S8Y6_9ALVE|eukprot:Cvel_27650.t2-p1 / transcript=Cvel_27650.t2 / gene=Cvel_27650 / organism=Chromera_velia_CCMP2878 / gene_product=hypothetical protein / transcript_product=hypothetical protein / location=Cvel_scaffold3483:4372-12804(-) / protein_length=441 / sequence_SO=supercontig / SO=protein_coding / is_pseudo=false
MSHWTKKWQRLGKGKPKIVKTDNGGEFEKEYDSFLQREGVHHERGPNYCSQVQGQVERPNRTVKRLLRKTVRKARLPRYTKILKWLFLGVVQQLNEVVSTVTGESPMKAVFGEEKAEEISPIAVGDRVVVYDPHPIKKGAEPVYGKECIFAFVENSSVVVVLIEKGNGWKPLRVHPSLVSLVRTSDMRADRQTKLMLERYNGDVPSTARVEKKEKAGARVKKIDFTKRSSMCMRLICFGVSDSSSLDQSGKYLPSLQSNIPSFYQEAAESIPSNFAQCPVSVVILPGQRDRFLVFVNMTPLKCDDLSLLTGKRRLTGDILINETCTTVLLESHVATLEVLEGSITINNTTLETNFTVSFPKLREVAMATRTKWCLMLPLPFICPDESQDAMTIRYQGRVGGEKSRCEGYGGRWSLQHADIGEGGVCNTPLTAHRGTTHAVT